MNKSIYYFPVYGCRYIPHLIHALRQVYEIALVDLKTTVYANRAKAIEEGQNMLVDDDTFQIFSVDFSHGYPILAECHNNDVPNDSITLQYKARDYFNLVE